MFRQGSDQPVGTAVFSAEGESATVAWTVVADPCPTVVWQKDGVNLDELPGKAGVPGSRLLDNIFVGDCKTETS